MQDYDMKDLEHRAVIKSFELHWVVEHYPCVNKSAIKKSRLQQNFHDVKNETSWQALVFVLKQFHQNIVYLSVHLLLQCICKTVWKK